METNTFSNYKSEFNATSAISNFIISEDLNYKNRQDFKQIIKIISKLIEGGVTFVGKGYCISMADIVYTLLIQNNIPCKIIECSLTITDKTKDQVYVVGFDGLTDDTTKTDNHVVIVTKTEIPYVIDTSIAHLLPNDMQAVVSLASDSGNDIFANVQTETINLTYKSKKDNKLPLFHQRSIIDRIETDNKIFKGISTLKIIIVVAVLISFLNASRGFYDLYMTFYSLESGFSRIERRLNEIDKRGDYLDQQLTNKKN